ncbi:hypothetical protein H0A36_17335 [Endozoicomonas sp. SM1973]|uniref:Uncharacterized protein n=1 Tax=Spartinivicinus marinus TaxID=2994442 RepID=A0A853I511_9GAMM|nr:hypothetical protein [Spartinivicinus marinus]MCX4029160.1 hypothetical protein [Spartinivicinus marinus]NYZ67779.1 hypothetical protein [Spartinivicinus marinus]
MHGDFQWPYGTPDGGHDGIEWSLVAQPNDNIGIKAVDIGAGHWKEWVENRPSIAFRLLIVLSQTFG